MGSTLLSHSWHDDEQAYRDRLLSVTVVDANVTGLEDFPATQGHQLRATKPWVVSAEIGQRRASTWSSRFRFHCHLVLVDSFGDGTEDNTDELEGLHILEVTAVFVRPPLPQKWRA